MRWNSNWRWRLTVDIILEKDGRYLSVGHVRAATISSISYDILIHLWRLIGVLSEIIVIIHSMVFDLVPKQNVIDFNSREHRRESHCARSVQFTRQEILTAFKLITNKFAATRRTRLRGQNLARHELLSLVYNYYTQLTRRYFYIGSHIAFL